MMSTSSMFGPFASKLFDESEVNLYVGLGKFLCNTAESMKSKEFSFAIESKRLIREMSNTIENATKIKQQMEIEYAKQI